MDKNLKQTTGWIGSTSYAQPGGKGDYPGATCMTFGSIKKFNKFFEENSSLLVIDVTYVPNWWGGTKVVAMVTNQLSPEEMHDIQEVQREVEYAMAGRRKERQALKEEQERVQVKNRQELERLAEIGAKYEARVRQIRGLKDPRIKKEAFKALNSGDLGLTTGETGVETNE